MKNINSLFFKTTFFFILTLNIAFGQQNIQKNNLQKDLKHKTSYYQEVKNIINLYNEMNLQSKIDFKTFETAMLGFSEINKKNDSVITIIDYTKPSTQKRLYVIDVKHKKILFETHVAHGRNSGENYAVNFSNNLNSYASSPGFYLTDTTYRGGNGYSLILNGLEKGINDKARERSIVIHGASYANLNGSAQRLGRSLGCPALPTNVYVPVINTIKNGSVLYIHVNDSKYTSNSQFVKTII